MVRAGISCAECAGALGAEREPRFEVHESIAMTAPDICAHESALRGSELLVVPNFGSP